MQVRTWAETTRKPGPPSHQDGLVTAPRWIVDGSAQATLRSSESELETCSGSTAASCPLGRQPAYATKQPGAPFAQTWPPQTSSNGGLARGIMHLVKSRAQVILGFLETLSNLPVGLGSMRCNLGRDRLFKPACQLLKLLLGNRGSNRT